MLKWERNLIVSKSIPYETEINAEFVIRNAELLIIKPVVIGFPDSNRLLYALLQKSLPHGAWGRCPAGYLKSDSRLYFFANARHTAVIQIYYTAAFFFGVFKR